MTKMWIHSFLSHCRERQSNQNHLIGTRKNQDQFILTILYSMSDQRYRNDLGQATREPNHIPNELLYSNKIVFCKTDNSYIYNMNGCEGIKMGGIEQ